MGQPTPQTLEHDALQPATRTDADANLRSPEGMLRGIVISALLWAMLLLLFV
jgi:hypothetical protein